MYLRDVLDALLGDKKYKVFREPIDLDEVPDYADVVKEPLLEQEVEAFDCNGKERTGGRPPFCCTPHHATLDLSVL